MVPVAKKCPKGDAYPTVTSHEHLNPEVVLESHWTRLVLALFSSVDFLNTFLHFWVVVVTKLYLKASNRKLLLGKLRFKLSVANNEPER